MDWDPELQTEWERQFGTEEDIEQHQATIERETLTAMVHLDLGPWRRGKRLWMLVSDPAEDRWTDMQEPDGLAEKLRKYPYRISMFLRDDVTRVG